MRFRNLIFSHQFSSLDDWGKSPLYSNFHLWILLVKVIFSDLNSEAYLMFTFHRLNFDRWLMVKSIIRAFQSALLLVLMIIDSCIYSMILSNGILILLYSWSSLSSSRRFSCNFSCLLGWEIALVFLRSPFDSDGIQGAILLSFMGVIYLFRGDDFPISFFASEGLIFCILAVMAIFCHNQI